MLAKLLVLVVGQAKKVSKRAFSCSSRWADARTCAWMTCKSWLRSTSSGGEGAVDSAPPITRRTSEMKTKKNDRLKSSPLGHVVFPNPRSDSKSGEGYGEE